MIWNKPSLLYLNSELKQIKLLWRVVVRRGGEHLQREPALDRPKSCSLLRQLSPAYAHYGLAKSYEAFLWVHEALIVLKKLMVSRGQRILGI